MIAVIEDILSSALQLRDRGLSVFPVSVTNKKPAVSWDRYQEELPTEDEIRADFAYAQKTYGECAVGVACGPVSNLFLLDFDFEKHPEAQEFFDNHEFPRTWMERTRSGGIHIYFRWSDDLSERQTLTQSKLWPGVDTKGYGGYSKVCPSPGYEWIVAPHMAPLAFAPDWLVEMLVRKPSNRVIGEYNVKAANWMIADLLAINPGDGQHGCTPTFTRIVGRLKAKGMSIEESKFLLLPWAKEHEYETRLDKLVEDQYRRYPQRADVIQEDSNHSLMQFLSNPEQHAYIIPDLLAEGTINVMAGLQESRKSWLLLDMAISIASGTPWLSKYPCQRRKVLVIDQERSKKEMKRRISALLAGRGIDPQTMEGFLVAKAETTFQLGDFKSFEAFTRLIETTHPQVVLIDSLKTIQSGDIKDSNAMQPLFEKFKELKTKHGVTLIILHHENNRAYQMIREKTEVTAETIEGSASIKQVPEGLFVVRNHDIDSSFVHHVKNSFGLKAAPFNVKVRDVTPDKLKIAVEAI